MKLEQIDFTILDVQKYLDGEMTTEECEQIANGFAESGVMLVKDPRVATEDSEAYLDMMESYYAQPWEKLQKDLHPEIGYHIGLTPPLTEIARDFSDWSRTLTPEHMPYTDTAARMPDQKLRFMWLYGPRAESHRWPSLNEKTPVPEDLEQMGEVLDTWCDTLFDAGTVVLEVLAIGFGWEKNTLTDMIQYGPHVLGPTGSELGDYTQEDIGTVLAGVHDDTNVITMHGRSRFRALIAWTKAGEPFLVRAPEGHLVCQAARELEYLTAGHVNAGMHEVVVLPETLEDVAKAKAAGRSTMRVSSNFFIHARSNKVLKPLGKFANTEEAKNYPPVWVGNFNMRTWVEIGLRSPEVLQSLPPDPTE